MKKIKNKIEDLKQKTADYLTDEKIETLSRNTSLFIGIAIASTATYYVGRRDGVRAAVTADDSFLKWVTDHLANGEEKAIKRENNRFYIEKNDNEDEE
jgi:hypothetical protein